MPLILNGDGSIGPLSSTEVGYLDGVTSAVQTQINLKINSQSWTNYTPTLSSWTQGNGTISGKYVVIGSTIMFWAQFTLGSTSSVTYSPAISLPTTGTGRGMATCWWVNTGSNYGTAMVIIGASSCNVYGIGSNGAEMAFSSVQSWGSGDQFTVSGFYEAA